MRRVAHGDKLATDALTVRDRLYLPQKLRHQPGEVMAAVTV
jgi:hypothetical protein